MLGDSNAERHEPEFDADGWLVGASQLTDNDLRKRWEFSAYLAKQIGEPVPTFTCEGCEFQHKCIYAFDLYNTDGDCLMVK